MPNVAQFDRNQLMVCSFDSWVEEDSTARLIDAFVNSLDIASMGVKEAAYTGRPSYDRKSLLKLYIFGCLHDIRSSRKLAYSCKTNIEVKWMIGGVTPDHRTIADFRKDNIKLLKKTFHEFNKRLTGAVDWGFVSIDGSKIQASNSKDKNFTKNKLDDRIKWLNGHMEEYLRILADIDEKEDLDDADLLTKETVEAKIAEAKERLVRYEEYQKLMEESGASQLSLTDADSKLMKSKNGFMVAYNPQTAVDSNTHLIRDFQMTNQVTDHGLMDSTLEHVKEEKANTVIEAVADKGYNNCEDMAKCLENGIIPHVITSDGKDGYTIEMEYEVNEVNPDSTEAEELKKCLHAGVIPEAYKDVISDIEVKDVRCKVKDNPQEVKSIYGTPEEMIARAKEGYFVRDPERNLVYCPMGETLTQKCIKKSGAIRFANKTACRHCKNRNKCYKGVHEWKEIDFTKDKLEKPCRDWLNAEGRTADKTVDSVKQTYKYVTKKMVSFFLKPDRNKTAQRMCLSEHPFGTIKRALGASYFLLRGQDKVAGEFALYCLGYNIARAKNLLGFGKMMELMG